MRACVYLRSATCLDGGNEVGLCSAVNDYPLATHLWHPTTSPSFKCRNNQCPNWLYNQTLTLWSTSRPWTGDKSSVKATARCHLKATQSVNPVKGLPLKVGYILSQWSPGFPYWILTKCWMLQNLFQLIGKPQSFYSIEHLGSRFGACSQKPEAVTSVRTSKNKVISNFSNFLLALISRISRLL